MAILDADDPWNPQPLDEVPGWFEDWEQQLSRFRDDSELSELNRSQGHFLRVSATLWEVFQEALRAEQISRGWVTPTIYDALVETGYTHSFSADMNCNPAGRCWFDRVRRPRSVRLR